MGSESAVAPAATASDAVEMELELAALVAVPAAVSAAGADVAAVEACFRWNSDPRRFKTGNAAIGKSSSICGPDDVAPDPRLYHTPVRLLVQGRPRVPGQEPGVDGEGLSGGVVCGRTGQVDGGPGQILHRPVVPLRQVLLYPAPPGGIHLRRHRRLDPPGGDGVDPDPV